MAVLTPAGPPRPAVTAAGYTPVDLHVWPEHGVCNQCM